MNELYKVSVRTLADTGEGVRSKAADVAVTELTSTVNAALSIISTCRANDELSRPLSCVQRNVQN